MLTSGSLIDVVSEALRLPKGTVAQFFRLCREAGLITSSGARGVNAPAMTFLDASRLIIALVGFDRPSTVANGAAVLCGLRTPFGDKNDRLDQAFAGILEALAANGELKGKIEIDASALEASLYEADPEGGEDKQSQVFLSDEMRSVSEYIKRHGLPNEITDEYLALTDLAWGSIEKGKFLHPSAISSKRSVDFVHLRDIAAQIIGDAK